MTNYQRGANKEYLAKKQLEEEGYLVTRAAGSHGIFDLVAIKDKVRLIQIKREKKKRAYNEENIMNNLIVPKSCTKELWVWQERKGWDKKVIP